MQNLWLNIKIWTKITLFTAVALYLILFLFKNSNQRITIWYWFSKEPIETSAIQLIPITLIFGVIGTYIVRMTYRAIRQIRELQSRNKHEQMTRDVEDLKSKAAMLNTKPPVATDPEK